MSFQIRDKREKRRVLAALLRKAILIFEVETMSSPLLEKSLDFAADIVLFYEHFSKTKRETTIAKQLLRAATSVGANINEAIYGNSKADFISKLHIALKEVSESIYWLTLLKRTKLVEYDYDKLLALAEEIKRMLVSSINTAKGNK